MWSSNDSKGPSKDDLHQWSIYRQNLNAALTNSSSSRSTINSTTQSNELTLKQETVNNILSSTNYRNESDANNYLKYGIPRAKQPSEQVGRVKNQIKLFNEKQNATKIVSPSNKNRKSINQNLSLNDDLDYNLSKDCNLNNSSRDRIKSTNRNAKQTSFNQESMNSLRKQWRSNPDLNPSLQDATLIKSKGKQSISAYDVRRNSELDASIQISLEQFKKYQNNEHKIQTNKLHLKQASKSDDDSLTKSTPLDELDFRKSSLNDDEDLSFEQNKLHKYAKAGLQSSDSEFVLSLDGGKCSSSKIKQPHLIANKLYHEFDSTSNCSILCGGARQKIRVLDNVSFEAKSGDILALIATNRKFVCCFF